MKFVDTLFGFVNAQRLKQVSLQAGAGVSGNGQIFEPLYRSDWAAKKICEIPANDATRAWRSWRADPDQIEAIEATEQRLGVQAVLNQALIWRALYGGAAIVIVDARAQIDAPLDVERLRAGDLLRLIPVSRSRISAIGALIDDPANPLFGMPSQFIVGVRNVHPSRVVILRGLPAPDDSTAFSGGASLNDSFWGVSVLASLQVALANAQVAQTGFARLIEEAKIDIVSIAALGDKLSTDESRARLLQRFELFAEGKGVGGVGLIDRDEEDYTQKQVTFTQASEIIGQYLSILAAASDIPATRLLGRSPQGMNATGDSDLRNYYDGIAAAQSNIIGPAIRNLDEAIIRDALGARPPEIWYDWRPLWQMSDAERATIHKTRAETSEIYARLGVFMPETLAKAVQSQLVDDGVYPGLEAALEEEQPAATNLPPDDEADDSDDADEQP